MNSSYSEFQYINFIKGNYLNIPVRDWYFTFYYDYLWRVSILFDVENEINETQNKLNDYFMKYYGNHLTISKGNSSNYTYVNYRLSANDTKDYICDLEIITHIDVQKIFI